MVYFSSLPLIPAGFSGSPDVDIGPQVTLGGKEAQDTLSQAGCGTVNEVKPLLAILIAESQ